MYPVDGNYVSRSEPMVLQRKRWKDGNVLWALLIGLIVVLIELVLIVSFNFDRVEGSLLGVILILLYSSILFFLLEPHILREIRHTQIRTIEKPVIKEVIRTVEKPIFRDVVRTVEMPVERKIYVPVTSPRKKLDIPKYEYFGSDDTKTYHHRNCRFRKLIKKKNQVHSNSESFFKKKKYSPCKVCILKERKG